jgi:hypothetical protein
MKRLSRSADRPVLGYGKEMTQVAQLHLILIECSVVKLRPFG